MLKVKLLTQLLVGLGLILSLNGCDIIQIFEDDPPNPCFVEQTTAGTHIAAKTAIEWNWNTVSEAMGYKYNTTDNYESATDNGAATNFTQTGLTCGISYMLYVWAYNDCGHSTSLQLSQSTAACNSSPGCETVTFNYNGSTVTYGTVIGANGRCWLDRNLGALQLATRSDDSLAYGDLFQWGRLDDGHQERTSLTTTVLSTTDVPGHNMFIMGGFGISDWRDPRNDLLWQGIDGINNPCPTGFRLPTKEEWESERQSWSSNDNIGAFASPLKLPLAGVRATLNAAVHGGGSRGHYWSSTVYGHLSWHLDIDLGTADLSYSDGRNPGFCVRCIQD